MREGKESENEVEKIIANQEENEPDSSNTKIQLSLIEILQNLSPIGFEHLCGRLLREYILKFRNNHMTEELTVTHLN
ncbi:MAG: hypothetical protein IPN97_09505 [Saprospiraceae bacterium]|nr:hypothetical protein [Saprospiraceae bacterium]